MYQNFIIPYLYEAQHVSGYTPPIIRSLKLHWQPLVFHTWKICAWQCPPTTRPTTFHLWKTRCYQYSFRLLMMGDVLPETCWSSYKYGIIKFWYIVASCWIFLYESYYDARIHEHQTATTITLNSSQHSVKYKSSSLTFWSWSWTFNFSHTIYVRCEYFTNQKR